MMSGNFICVYAKSSENTSGYIFSLVSPLGLPFQLLQDVLFPCCTETLNMTYDTLALVPLYHH